MVATREALWSNYKGKQSPESRTYHTMPHWYNTTTCNTTKYRATPCHAALEAIQVLRYHQTHFPNAHHATRRNTMHAMQCDSTVRARDAVHHRVTSSSCHEHHILRSHVCNYRTPLRHVILCLVAATTHSFSRRQKVPLNRFACFASPKFRIPYSHGSCSVNRSGNSSEVFTGYSSGKCKNRGETGSTRKRWLMENVISGEVGSVAFIRVTRSDSIDILCSKSYYE